MRELIPGLAKEREDNFYKNLKFATGSSRALMGLSNNSINKYTLGKTTQRLSNYMSACFPEQLLKAVVAYDCRQGSASLVKRYETPN